MSKYEFSGTTALPETFDPSQQEGSFEPLPVGMYQVEVIEASINEAKNGSGDRINFTLKVNDGDYEGRYLWHGITLSHNTSVQAVDIGKRQLKDLCVACGITEVVTDVKDFLFKPFMARVNIQKDKDGVYSDQNRVARTLPIPDILPPPKGASLSERLNDKINY